MPVALIPIKSPLKIEIFAIDDDPGMRELISDIFKMNNIDNYRIFAEPQHLLASLTDNVHICIVDYILNNDMNGLDLIKEIVKRNPHTWFIMLSGQSDQRVVVDYMNAVYGSRYIEKGSAAVPLHQSLIQQLNDIIRHIYFIDDFYQTANRIQEGMRQLKNLITT